MEQDPGARDQERAGDAVDVFLSHAEPDLAAEEGLVLAVDLVLGEG